MRMRIDKATEAWYEDLYRTLKQSSKFKFRWIEKAHVKARYFTADKKGVIGALPFIKELHKRDIAGLGIWFKSKRQPINKPRSYGFYYRRCHAIEDYEAILAYFIYRFTIDTFVSVVKVNTL